MVIWVRNSRNPRKFRFNFSPCEFFEGRLSFLGMNIICKNAKSLISQPRWGNCSSMYELVKQHFSVEN